MSISPLSKLNEEQLRDIAGLKVRKRSGKPFHSKLWTNTVKDMIVHPITKRWAFTFHEDETFVDVNMILLGADELHPED